MAGKSMKIYHGPACLELVADEQLPEVRGLNLHEHGALKQLMEHPASAPARSYTLPYPSWLSPSAVLSGLLQAFEWQRAAGGMVQAPDGRLLVMHRRGHWDLPKGKVDPGETIAQAALREVEEETGASGLSLLGPLPSTYHIYRHKNRWVLKKTHWFAMRAPKAMLLRAQTEEDITEVRWATPAEVEGLAFYASLEPLISFFQHRFPR